MKRRSDAVQRKRGYGVSQEKPDYYLVGELECYVCHEKFRANEEFNKHLSEAGHRLDAVPVGPPAAAPPPAPQSPDEGIDWPAPKIVDTVVCVSLEKYNKLVAAAESAAHLQAELERVRKQGTDAVLDLKEQMREMKVRHNDDLKAAEARCRVLEEALRKYWHCRHAWMIDCFCTKEARAALAPG